MTGEEDLSRIVSGYIYGTPDAKPKEFLSEDAVNSSADEYVVKCCNPVDTTAKQHSAS